MLNALPLSPVSVGHVRSVLRTALAHAMRAGLLERNVAALAEAPRIRQRERRWLSAAEARRLLDATADDRLHALYVLALTTGMRQGELLALSWDDIDEGTVTVRASLARIDGEWVRLTPKTDRGQRTIVLTAEASAALADHRRRMAAERTPDWRYHGLVFTTARGEPIHGSNLIPPLRAYLASEGLPAITWHDLRHSAASVMLAAGVPLRVIADILGHSTIRITADLYAHVGPELQRDAAERVSAALR
jgi:integrase